MRHHRIQMHIKIIQPSRLIQNVRLKCTSKQAQVFAEISHFKLFNIEFYTLKKGNILIKMHAKIILLGRCPELLISWMCMQFKFKDTRVLESSIRGIPW